MLPEQWSADVDSGLDEDPHWEPGQLRAVDRGNAQLLIPGLVRS